MKAIQLLLLSTASVSLGSDIVDRHYFFSNTNQPKAVGDHSTNWGGDDDGVGMERNLQNSYIQPSYWQRYRDQYDRRIKRCKFLQNMAPASGTSCQKMKTGDYTCLFGEITCPADGLTHPTQTCSCEEPSRKFKCQEFSPCTFSSPSFADTCPASHPAAGSETAKCSKSGIICNYGSQTCCNGQTFETTSCVCGADGLFKCTNNFVCRTGPCPPPSQAKPGPPSPFPTPATISTAQASRPAGGAAGVLSSGEKVSMISTKRTIKYSVNFTNLWKSQRHPFDYPPSAHWSPPVVATHNATYRMWMTGELSTAGVQQVAETGSTVALQSEMSGKVGGTSIGKIMWNNIEQFQVIRDIELSPTSNLISTITMVAPSPDWFTGFSGLYPETNGFWWSSFSILTYAFDAGTDSGTSYSSPDQPKNPASPVSQIDETNSPGPFVLNGAVLPIGKWTFTLKREPVQGTQKGKAREIFARPSFNAYGSPAVTPAMSPAQDMGPAITNALLGEPTFTQDLSEYLNPPK